MRLACAVPPSKFEMSEPTVIYEIFQSYTRNLAPVPFAREKQMLPINLPLTISWMY